MFLWNLTCRTFRWLPQFDGAYRDWRWWYVAARWLKGEIVIYGLDMGRAVTKIFNGVVSDKD